LNLFADFLGHSFANSGEVFQGCERCFRGSLLRPGLIFLGVTTASRHTHRIYVLYVRMCVCVCSRASHHRKHSGGQTRHTTAHHTTAYHSISHHTSAPWRVFGQLHFYFRGQRPAHHLHSRVAHLVVGRPYEVDCRCHAVAEHGLRVAKQKKINITALWVWSSPLNKSHLPHIHIHIHMYIYTHTHTPPTPIPTPHPLTG